MKDWKIVVFFSGIALVLSMAAGILGGVSFLVVMLRALSGALVFGGLGFAVSYTVRKFLPELFDPKNPGASEEVEADSDVSGSNVDIVIDDPGEEYPLEEEIPVVNTVDTLEVDENEYGTDEEEDSGKIPDIESLGGAFEVSDSDDVDNVSAGGKLSVDIMGEEQDPAMVAQAIRTIIKKDQEG